MLYGTLTEFCTDQTCPIMSAGPKYVRIALFFFKKFRLIVCTFQFNEGIPLGRREHDQKAD